MRLQAARVPFNPPTRHVASHLDVGGEIVNSENANFGVQQNDERMLSKDFSETSLPSSPWPRCSLGRVLVLVLVSTLKNGSGTEKKGAASSIRMQISSGQKHVEEVQV